jgi:Protein of unknown function (DUF2721)
MRERAAGQGQSTRRAAPFKIVSATGWRQFRALIHRLTTNMPITLGAGDTYTTLSAMITPAIFLTANASLIISTSNRVSRVVDRIRVLNDLADKLGRGVADLDFASERLEHVNDQMNQLERRGDRLRFALAALYLAFTSFVGTSLFLAIDALLKNTLVALPTILAVAGVALLLFASINLVREALLALRSNRLEIRFYRELQERRRAGRAHIESGAA